MTPILCIIGGCNGAGKTTLARELLPRMSIKVTPQMTLAPERKSGHAKQREPSDSRLEAAETDFGQELRPLLHSM